MEQLISYARWQFAATTIYHFFFVPLTIGLSFFIAIMESLYVKTKDEKYKKMTKFWGHLFLINFAMGVATGIVQEFQFGMNWSAYSTFVGDIFGVPLAIEALLAFFMESTFIGIWIFGWDRVSKKLHLLSIWMVAIGTTISAFWILTANSFMHEPVGYKLENGRAVMTSFDDVIKNPHLLVQFPHTIFAAWCTASFFVLGISAYYLLKNNHAEWVKASFKFGVTAAIISSLLAAFMGDVQGKFLVKNLPMKMAAAEAVWETKDPAPFGVIAIIDEKGKRNTFEISIPKLLSFMSYSKFTGKVEGLNDLQKEYEQKYGPGNYIPPVTISFYTFRIMVGSGVLMILLSLAALFFSLRKNILQKKLLLKLLMFAIALPYIANSTGWILTEMSRSPWIVFGLLKIQDAVSPTVSAASVLTSLLVFVVLYAILMIIDISLSVSFIKKPLLNNRPSGSKLSVDEEGSLWI